MKNAAYAFVFLLVGLDCADIAHRAFSRQFTDIDFIGAGGLAVILAVYFSYRAITQVWK